jgi:hypothetical protein
MNTEVSEPTQIAADGTSGAIEGASVLGCSVTILGMLDGALDGGELVGEDVGELVGDVETEGNDDGGTVGDRVGAQVGGIVSTTHSMGMLGQ